MAPTGKVQPPALALVAAANGVARAGISGADALSARAQAKVSEALFDAGTVNVNALKINLMERLGEELGLSMDEFETAASFGAAVRAAIGQIKMQDGGALRLAEIERKLGLNKLGISLDTLVNAIMDPDGDDAAKLDAALRKDAGEAAKDDGKPDARAALSALRHDDSGLYTL